MSTVGTFTLIKSEIPWIRAHLESWLPHVDQMVFFDGNSTDGTLEVLKKYWLEHPLGYKITLVQNKDPKDLRDDYVRLFDQCLHALETDFAIFAHPDMLIEEPGNIRSLDANPCLAHFCHMRSFAGEPGGQLYEIKTGRAEKWKNIYRLRNPDFGLHYFGHYGAWNEDCYFSKITGSEHEFFGEDFDRYPYEVGDSGIRLLHYSDVRSYERRFGRMRTCLINQGHGEIMAEELAAKHPRVTLRNGKGFEFVPAEPHPLLKEAAHV